MRDPNRLYNFYSELMMIHQTKFPDMRFGQFMDCLFSWLLSRKSLDGFYIEDDEMLKYIKEYTSEIRY